MNSGPWSLSPTRASVRPLRSHVKLNDGRLMSRKSVSVWPVRSSAVGRRPAGAEAARCSLPTSAQRCRHRCALPAGDMKPQFCQAIRAASRLERNEATAGGAGEDAHGINRGSPRGPAASFPPVSREAADQNPESPPPPESNPPPPKSDPPNPPKSKLPPESYPPPESVPAKLTSPPPDDESW